jgi:hypothetical protein
MYSSPLSPTTPTRRAVELLMAWKQYRGASLYHALEQRDSLESNTVETFDACIQQVLVYRRCYVLVNLDVI